MLGRIVSVGRFWKRHAAPRPRLLSDGPLPLWGILVDCLRVKSGLRVGMVAATMRVVFSMLDRENMLDEWYNGGYLTPYQNQNWSPNIISVDNLAKFMMQKMEWIHGKSVGSESISVRLTALMMEATIALKTPSEQIRDTIQLSKRTTRLDS